MTEFLIDAAQAGERIDAFLAARLPKYSRASITKLFDGHVELNNEIIVKAGYKLRLGDKVGLDTAPLELVPPSITIPVMYEDEDVMVLEKPAGILTHAKGVINIEATVATFIAPFYRLSGGEILTNRSGIVHRLDRDTSGVIICAKNLETQRFLQSQFSSRKVHKVYIAVVEGMLEPAKALIDAPITRNPKRPQTFKVDAVGRSALTAYRVLGTYEGTSLVELIPQTGRTHQLRVHLRYINHSIVGDRFYGQGNGRLMLHASSIELKLPGGQMKVFTAKLPNAFNKDNFIA